MLPDLAPLTIRTAFEQAIGWFVETVAGIEPHEWAGPGLGEWNVRELVGHTSRAITTVDQYLDTPAERATLVGPLAYWRTMFGAGLVDHDAVAERGRQAGVTLGDDPVATVWALADSLLNRLAGVTDDALLGVAGAGITLVDYLPSRIIELDVHTLDLRRALGRDLDAPVLAADAAVSLLVAFGDPATVLLALLGRGGNLFA